MNCKPGILAYVVFALHAECIGKVVRVIKAASFLGVDCWQVEFEGAMPVCLLDLDERFAMDSWLRPISGVPLHDEQHDEVSA